MNIDDNGDVCNDKNSKIDLNDRIRKYIKNIIYNKYINLWKDQQSYGKYVEYFSKNNNINNYIFKSINLEDKLLINL